MTLVEKLIEVLKSPASAVCVAAFAAGFTAHKLSSRHSASTSSSVRSTTASGSVVYESSRAVDEYLLFHFLPGNQLCPYELAPQAALDFPKRCADLCAKHAPRGERLQPRPFAAR
jgi:hypothetical protein